MTDDQLSPLVRAAIAALDSFGAVTVSQARTLMGIWARRRELSDADVAAVLGHFDDERPGTTTRPTVRRSTPPGSHRPGGPR